MSRTDKDRPYWVMLNDEGVIEHDHTFCWNWGGGTTRTRWGKPLFDDEGNPIMETIEETQKASHYAKYGERTLRHTRPVYYTPSMTDSMLYTRQNFMLVTVSETANPLWSEAQHLVAIGKGETEMIIRTYQRQKREEIEYSIAQECTEDMPEVAHERYGINGIVRTCTRRMPEERKRRYCSCDMCEPGGIWAEKKSRSAKRNTLRNMAKAYDGEEGWEDPFEERELYLAKPLRYTSQWC